MAPNNVSSIPTAPTPQWRSPTAAMRIRPFLVLVDGVGPPLHGLLAHRSMRTLARVRVAPVGDVGKVLGAGQEGAPADPFGRLRRVLGIFELPREHARPPARLRRRLGGIDELEEQEVAEQHAPVRAEATHQTIPVELGVAGGEGMAAVGPAGGAPAGGA